MIRLLPLASDARPRAAALVRAAIIAVVLVWTIYLIYVLTGPWGLGLQTVFRTWVFSGILLGASAICLVRALLVTHDRVAWAILGSGMALWALATVYWSAFLKELAEPPYPSVADALYLGFYPAAYVALMLLLRKRLRGVGASVWLDGLIGAFAVGAIGVAFVVPSVVDVTGGSLAVVATNLAYPLGDLLLIALVVAMFALTAWRPGRKWLLIGAGVVLFAIADTVYLYQVANGTFVEGQFIDAIWPAGMVLLALAAWQSQPARPTVAFEGWPVLVAPSFFTLGSLAVLVYGNVAETNVASVALAGATVVAALLRLALSFRELRALAETRRQATTDELTGLTNRRFLYEQLREAVADEREPVTLLVADLDRFKELNDTLGHHAGDLLLKQVGPRLLDVLTARDTLARLGGDEFAVLLRGRDAQAAIEVVERIHQALDRAFTVRGLAVHIEASIGVASFPEHGDSVEALVQRADVAMYQAKAAHTGFEIYARHRDEYSPDRLALLGDLRRAIDAGELVLHYQPKVSLRSGEVTGVEALVRWEHPKRGLLSPKEFLAPAEHTTLMRPLTLRVLRTALEQLRVWLERGLDLTVAVNLSVPNLRDVKLPDDVFALLAECGVAPDRLHLEVTENIVMADPVHVLGVLERLEAIGVGVSMDDFGTGSSSLSYLTQLPLDELKIDRSFVMSMERNESHAVIIQSTIELAQRLGLRVVAEGVETAEAWVQLSSMGCDEGQGFFLQRPRPADELGKWLLARRANGTQALGTAVPLPHMQQMTGLGIRTPRGT